MPAWATSALTLVSLHIVTLGTFVAWGLCIFLTAGAHLGSIMLSADEAKRYEQAVNLSEEGGPCCCRCWRWDAFEGQAKLLIAEYDWPAEEIAELWELEDGCGGDGHLGHG